MYRSHVLVCGGTGCTSSHSAEIIEKLEQELKAKGLENEVKVIKTGCFGLCALGPVMIVYPEGCFYSEVKVEDVPEIVEEHLLKGRMVKRLLYEETVHKEDIKPLKETNFYKKQHRVALRNCGVIDPENIEEYIAMDGYQALAKCLTELTPDEVIQIVKYSGLRGRGGCGFPTGLKWSFTAKNSADQKYVVCNADEGDPGAFMDRSVLEGDPHCIVEAMTICGYATGATEGYVYVRAEYPIAVHRLDVAIKEAREAGLLGKNIFNSGFDFDLHIRLGAGISFNSLPDETYDSPLGEGSGAAVIFGATGGVMEAALRTAVEKITGQALDNVDFTEVRGMEGVKEATYTVGDLSIKVAVASGTKNAKTLMEQIKNGTSEYQFIEIMGCPGGCINGGGQPIVSAAVRNFEDFRSKRASVLYNLDKNNENRKSHENSAIKRVYDEFFGEPGSHKAHEVLHTTYVKRGLYNN